MRSAWRYTIVARPVSRQRRQSVRPAAAPNARDGSNAKTPGSDPGRRTRPGAQKAGDPRVRRGPYAKVVERNARCSSGSAISRPSIRSGATAGSGPPALRRRPDRQREADLRRREGVRPPGAADLKLRARRKVGSTKPRPTWPNQRSGIDMTKVRPEDFGSIYLVVVLDCTPRSSATYRPAGRRLALAGRLDRGVYRRARTAFAIRS